MPDAFPKLRGEIDASPVTHEGTVYYIVYDRAGVAPARLAVTPLALEVASRLDGHTSVLDLTDQVRHATGVVLTCSEVDAVVDTLDRSLFLDNAFFQDHLAQADRDFQASPLRPASSAGSAYPDDPGELATELERLLSSAPPPEESLAREGAAPAGAIVPHIDFSRGGHAYGQLYSFLRSRPAPKTVVVVGTAHLPLPGRYSLCLKDFATPLGQLPLDRERSEVIRRHLAPYGGVEQGLLAHRGEHSVELQAVWLRHIYGDKVGLVPLLAA
ncbi:MAG: AmmeMemoRadiSam system protein B, partial [Planctomycetota bacterium]|nr:AmmeMemoRadiSam system protein B [Planctomycetota bacterium]